MVTKKQSIIHLCVFAIVSCFPTASTNAGLHATYNSVIAVVVVVVVVVVDVVLTLCVLLPCAQYARKGYAISRIYISICLYNVCHKNCVFGVFPVKKSPEKSLVSSFHT